jgi:hypothetical protein
MRGPLGGHLYPPCTVGHARNHLRALQVPAWGEYAEPCAVLGLRRRTSGRVTSLDLASCDSLVGSDSRRAVACNLLCGVPLGRPHRPLPRHLAPLARSLWAVPPNKRMQPTALQV